MRNLYLFRGDRPSNTLLCTANWDFGTTMSNILEPPGGEVPFVFRKANSYEKGINMNCCFILQSLHVEMSTDTGYPALDISKRWYPALPDTEVKSGRILKKGYPVYPYKKLNINIYYENLYYFCRDLIEDEKLRFRHIAQSAASRVENTR